MYIFGFVNVHLWNYRCTSLKSRLYKYGIMVTEVYELHSGGRIKYVGQVADNKRSDISG